jgi:hypothetical protein
MVIEYKPLNQNRMKTEKQQSAVEWLVEQLFGDNEIIGCSDELLQQAKEMEKEQIMDAYRINPNNENWSNSGIDYYNETFKSE